jgi:hypothetical protein
MPFSSKFQERIDIKILLEQRPSGCSVYLPDSRYDSWKDVCPEELAMAEKTIEKFLARAVRLYEQEREEPFGSPRLGLYVRRWVR